MELVTTFLILLIFAFVSENRIKCEPDWTYDFISFNVDNKSPETVYIDLTVSRPSRGVFAVSGIVDLKEDITDELIFTASMYFSMSGGSNYVKSPYYIPQSNLTEAMNRYYKELIMDSLLNCTDNAPRIEGKFVAPLTKRLVRGDNCLVSNENMPSKLKSGYYKVILEYQNQAEGTIEIVIRVEKK